MSVADFWANPYCDAEEYVESFAEKYYDKNFSADIMRDIRAFADNIVSFGLDEDKKAGGYFYNHLPQVLIEAYMENDKLPAVELTDFYDLACLEFQNKACREKLVEAQAIYDMYYDQCRETQGKLDGPQRIFYQNTVLTQARVYRHCVRGGVYVTKSLTKAFAGDRTDAFYWAGRGMRAFKRAFGVISENTYNPAETFYIDGCKEDISQSVSCCKKLMSALRDSDLMPQLSDLECWEKMEKEQNL